MSDAIRCFKMGGPCTVDVREKPRSVFVIMPFAPAFDKVYERGIKASVEALGWKCRRADEIIHNRDIMCQVCQGIRQTRFVIADLTGQNVNVFYELGMAHALEKDVILLAQDVGDVPFDLRQMNIIEYDTILPLRQRLTETLGMLVEEERPAAPEEIFQAGDIKLDERSGKVWVEGKPVSPDLTKLEFTLLSCLFKRRGEICSRSELLEVLYPGESRGSKPDMMDDRLYTLIGRLRHKIELDRRRPKYIITVRGRGFKLAEATPENL